MRSKIIFGFMAMAFLMASMNTVTATSLSVVSSGNYVVQALNPPVAEQACTVTAVTIEAQAPCGLFSSGKPGPQVQLSCNGTLYDALITTACPPVLDPAVGGSDENTIDRMYQRLIHNKIQESICEDYRRDISKYYFYSIKSGDTVDVDIASLTEEAKATWPAECPQHMILKSHFTAP